MKNVRGKAAAGKAIHDTVNRVLSKYGSDILRSERFRSSDRNIQHGNVSVMRHSIDVARMSVQMNRRWHLRCAERDLVRGALLHDYFLYDWHNHRDRRNTHPNLHGFYHPGIALKNALRDYRLTKREQDIIKKHMWPLTVVPPACREAWVVTLADKYVSLKETLHRR